MIISFFKRMFSGEGKYTENRQECALPDVKGTEEDSVIVPERFRNDITALEEYTGRKLMRGMRIRVSLGELLSVVPRRRRKADAYGTLTRFMKEELGVTLEIVNSRKKKGEDNED